MSLIIHEEPITCLTEHATIPNSFLVDRRLDVATCEDGGGTFAIAEVAVDPPWVKDYDRVEGEGPTRWPNRFDVSNWGLIAAHENGVRIAGAVIAFMTDGVDMLEGRSDLAVLWDIRVTPDRRSRGVGRAIFQAVERWARQRGCSQLKVETQDIKVSACRFYARMG